MINISVSSLVVIARDRARMRAVSPAPHSNGKLHICMMILTMTCAL